MERTATAEDVVGRPRVAYRKPQYVRVTGKTFLFGLVFAFAGAMSMHAWMNPRQMEMYEKYRR